MSVVGFDLGHQSCYIAVARQGGIETIANEYSDRLTPTCVSYGDRSRSMGAAAKQQIISNLKNTVWGWKKLIGRKFSDPIVQREQQFLPYKLVEMAGGGVGIQVNYLNETSVFTPEQVTATMFTKLKEISEANMQTKVVDCVLSVPNYFTDVERRALLDSTKMAGLNCLRLMNDTTATALAYGIYKQDLPAPEEKARNVIFIDLGHSDLQVAACAFNKGKLKVLATAAHPTLGGRDFDRLLVEHFSKVFLDKYKVDAKSSPKATIRLSQECEKLKKLMSANSTAIPLNIECFMEDKDVTGKLKRAEMEAMAGSLLQEARQTIQSILALASLKPDDIYSVEIVGGSTRVPAIKAIVLEVFGKEPSTTLNADEAVAPGCALQCAILSPTFRVRDFSITDSLPYPITLAWNASINDAENEMEVYSRFHQFPFSKMLTFYRQDAFKLEARYAGTVPHPATAIGSFHIDKVCPQSNGESSKVKVKVRVNIHGIFTVASASMVEKLDSPEEEETKEEEAKSPESMEVENGPKGAGEPNGEQAPTNEEPMETDQKSAETKEASPSPAPEADKDVKETPPAKKKTKVKTIDLPVSEVVSQLLQTEINAFYEKECQMIAQDRLKKKKVPTATLR